MRTSAGRDLNARVLSDPDSDGTGDYASAYWMGVTADDTDPDDGDTTLTDEVASGTLARAEAAFSHVDGTSTYTLTKTWTADQEIVIAKIGIFNAASDGVMAFETLLNSPAPLEDGDQVAITELVNL